MFYIINISLNGTSHLGMDENEKSYEAEYLKDFQVDDNVGVSIPIRKEDVISLNAVNKQRNNECYLGIMKYIKLLKF